MPRDLSVGERVAAQKALKAALALCDLVIGSTDDVLGPQVESILNARPTADRLKQIRQEFSMVRQALAATPLANINREDADYYAEVDPDVPYYITLGNAFFSASASGVDSRAGTLIHEATHWKIVRGTDDHAYGGFQNLSMALARNNAQNLERIAEGLEKQ